MSSSRRSTPKRSTRDDSEPSMSNSSSRKKSLTNNNTTTSSRGSTKKKATPSRSGSSKKKASVSRSSSSAAVSTPRSSTKKKSSASSASSFSKKKSSTPRRTTAETPRSSKKKAPASARRRRKEEEEEDDNEEEQQNHANGEFNIDDEQEQGDAVSRRTLPRYLDELIPSDARSIDVNQLARLEGLSSSPNPLDVYEEKDEEIERQGLGPKGYLTQQGLQTLKEYKYASGFTGATDKYLMIPLWNWCLQFVPIWMAPNLLTTMSLACGVACYFLFQYHSPDFLDVPPSWVFYLTSFLMFFYLILDGLDGKQARKTGSSSPLGQLFDHGLDAICCFLCGIFISTVLQLGSHRASAIVLVLHILPFYTSNWEELTTGVMRFGVIGITEGQLFICALLAITGYIGVDAWNTRVELPKFLADYAPSVLKPSLSEPMEYKFILIALGTVGVMYQVISSAMSVWEYHTLHAEERRTAKIYMKAKRMYAHFILFMSAGMAWVWAPSRFFEEHSRIVLLTIGILFGYQVSRLIISRVTKDPYPFAFLNMVFLPYGLLILNCWIGEPLPTYPLSIAYLCLIFLVYAHFAVTTINQICSFLKINCFSIPYPKTKKVQ